MPRTPPWSSHWSPRGDSAPSPAARGSCTDPILRRTLPSCVSKRLSQLSLVFLLQKRPITPGLPIGHATMLQIADSPVNGTSPDAQMRDSLSRLLRWNRKTEPQHFLPYEPRLD